jgi:hypothetical protein
MFVSFSWPDGIHFPSYEDAPFLFDFFLPGEFPLVPPQAFYHSWTGGIGRINPNLYEEGKGAPERASDIELVN